ncbi:hypothetical protein [Foetidibacter luteolus]|uniref:hypothetical protein n=1 Tax=Foetidibacter luteolus TaxID=2608880 RepID=UPI00129BAD12|nr:hypothetical protein [Foetidibacter luteolus]
MPRHDETRIYKVPDADLKQLADDLAASIDRDLNHFAERMITAQQLATFNTLIGEFDACDTDVEQLGNITTATEEKDTITDNLRKAIRPIRNMAELAYEGKSRYNSFGFDDLSKQTDNELYRTTRRICRLASQFMSDLAPHGLTPAHLLALENLATQLDNAIDKVAEAMELRDIQAQERIFKGNALWTEMARLASIGRSIFEDTNEALYNDYVLIGGNGNTGTNTPPPLPQE